MDELINGNWYELFCDKTIIEFSKTWILISALQKAMD